MLRVKARSAALWSSGDVLIKNGLNFVVTIVLARLLTPQEFGTVALLALFSGIAGPFIDAGFSAALVQKQDVTHIDESTVFWFNLGAGSACAVTLFLFAPGIAGFYKLPVLEPLVWMVAANIIVTALSSVQMALMTKRLDFRTLMRVNTLGIVCSAVVAISMAWAGFGVWALAWQVTVLSGVTTALAWFFSPWRPTWCFSIQSLQILFGFGGYLSASTLLHNLYTNAYTVIIGRFFMVTELGLYQRAMGLSDSFSSLLSTVVGRVSFPVFATIADDPERMKRGARLSLQGSMLFNAPAMVGLCVVAEPLILTLYGEAWRPATPYLQILAIAGLFMPVHSINLNLLLAQGHSRQYFALEIAKKILGLISLLAGAYYAGVIGVAWATLAIAFLSMLVNALYTERHIGYGLVAQIRDIIPTLLTAATMGGVVYIVQLFLPTTPTQALFIQLLMGIISFTFLAYVFRLAAFHQTWKLLRNPRVTQ